VIVAAFGTLNPSRRALHNLLERDTRGIALHITSRVARLGGTDDILVVRTVKDIVAGSGIKFEAHTFLRAFPTIGSFTALPIWPIQLAHLFRLQLLDQCLK
jgi:hypothetical protein